jgi:hypothetical protein
VCAYGDTDPQESQHCSLENGFNRSILIGFPPYIECRPNIVVKNVPKKANVWDVVIEKLKRVKMGIVFHVGMKCFMNPTIVPGVMKNLLWEQMGIVQGVGPNGLGVKKYLQSLMLMKSMN